MPLLSGVSHQDKNSIFFLFCKSGKIKSGTVYGVEIKENEKVTLNDENFTVDETNGIISRTYNDEILSSIALNIGGKKVVLPEGTTRNMIS